MGPNTQKHYPTKLEYTFFSNTCGTFSKIDLMLGHETNLLRYVVFSKYITSMYIETFSPDNIIFFYYNNEIYVRNLRRKT